MKLSHQGIVNERFPVGKEEPRVVLLQKRTEDSPSPSKRPGIKNGKAEQRYI